MESQCICIKFGESARLLDETHLGHDVGLATVDDRGSGWAISGIGSHDLGGVDGRVVVSGIGTNSKGSKGSDGEKHLGRSTGGIYLLFGM